MESDGSLPHSQASATRPYPGQAEISSVILIYVDSPVPNSTKCSQWCVKFQWNVLFVTSNNLRPALNLKIICPACVLLEFETPMDKYYRWVFYRVPEHGCFIA